MSPQFFIIRHGVSVANLQEYNDVDAPLHPHGVEQIKTSARALEDYVREKNVVILYSPLKRARDTAMIMLNEIIPHTSSVKLIRADEIREQRNVISDLLSRNESLGETEDELEVRCNLLRQRLNAPGIREKDIVLVVSHGMFLWKLIGKRMMPQNAQLIRLS